MSYINIRRGDIIYIDLDDVSTVGSEQKGSRFGVVLQNDTGNRYSSTTIVAMITSNLKHKIPTHVYVGTKGTGLSVPSVVLCEQIKTIDKQRIVKKCGRLSEYKLNQVDRALKNSMGVS